MFDGLFITSLITTFIQGIKEKLELTVPVENWGNKDLFYEDLMNGVPVEQRMENLKNGKYKLTETYPKPHRDSNGKIIIENCLLYNQDLKNYDSFQVAKWIQQGKYNLTPEELKKEDKRIEKEIEKLCSL